MARFSTAILCCPLLLAGSAVQGAQSKPGWVPASAVAEGRSITDPRPFAVRSNQPLPAVETHPGPGAFRIVCAASHQGRYDPIIYPGKAVAGHGHQFYGNVGLSGLSTYSTLRAEKRPSTCGGVLNQSAYWIPDLRIGDRLIRPGWIGLYYKRYPSTDPECRSPVAARCAGIPAGIRMVAGYDMVAMRASTRRVHHFYCIRSNRMVGERSTTFGAAAAACQKPGDQMFGAIAFPDCWDGVHVDSPDHRSHIAYRKGTADNSPCPASHPVVIPTLTQIVVWDVSGLDAGTLRLSSDVMDGHAHPAGETFHADYMEAWDPATRLTWEKNCLDQRRSCSAGNLGNGTVLAVPHMTLRADPRFATIRD